jgi:hypothetical protein
MAGSIIENLNISFTKRNARRRGPTSSYAWNDIFDEISSDFSGIYDQWNNLLRPLVATVPDGTVDTNIDAFTNGLDGQTLYVKSDSTATDTTYYNSDNTRPNTIYEQIAALYIYVDDINTNLGNSITNSDVTAANVTIADTGSLYDSLNVEDALSEVKELVDNLVDSNLFLPLSGGNLVGQVSNQIPAAMEPTGTTQTIDFNNGNIQVIDLNSATGTVTLTFENARSGTNLLLKVIQGATARNITWPAAVIWPGGSAPTISHTEDDIDIVSIIYDGTNYISVVEKNFS